jgi:hypothetical protein
MTEILASAAAFVMALAALLVALGIIAKYTILGRPFRWVWRRNVTAPISGWVRHTVGDVVDERIDYLMHNRNGGSSLLDLAESLKAVEGHVELLLSHDAERDTAGRRYGPDPQLPEQEGTN